MNARRIIVWIGSILFGLTTTVAVIAYFGVGFERFSTGFLFVGDLPLLVFAGFGSLAFIWLDFIFQTKYLKA